MIESLYIAETGMASQQRMLDIISNNIANTSTPGFKKAGVNFVDLVTNVPQTEHGLAQRQSIPQGAGVKIHSTSTDFSVGGMKQTTNPFDVAINGKGFFEVVTEDGNMAYSRTSRLRLDVDGFLSTSTGQKLAANIQIPPDAKGFVITNAGEVLVDLPSEEQLVQIGTLELAAFANTDGLQQIGENLYSATEEAGRVVFGRASEEGFGQLMQGFTETSNVSMTEEMVNLMLAQRGYQLNARIIQVSDQILETINNLRR